VRAGGNDLADVAAGFVREHDRGAAGGLPLVAPLAHGGEDQPQILALLGQGVVVADRVLLIRVALEDTVLNQVVEPVGEDVP
jgi:hypothetical protein